MYLACCPGKGSELGNGLNPEYPLRISVVRTQSEEMEWWRDAD